MKITVAGERKEVKDGITVAELIELEKVETPEYVTVSVNEEFLESGTFDSTVLKKVMRLNSYTLWEEDSSDGIYK